MDHDIGDLLADAELVSPARPAKMVTALRIDLDIHREIERVAAARGMGSSRLMRLIIEEWIATHRDQPEPDQFDELVRHLDAARLAADAIARLAT